MTDNIAQRESLGDRSMKVPTLKVSNKGAAMLLTFSERSHRCRQPSDARWAMLFVAVGD